MTRHGRGARGHPLRRAPRSRSGPAPPQGFELDIITIVLLGGVSIFGGSGIDAGRRPLHLLVLNLRNGMSLAGVTGNTQTGVVVGLLLILSVLLPNLVKAWARTAAARAGTAGTRRTRSAGPRGRADIPKAATAGGERYRRLRNGCGWVSCSAFGDHRGRHAPDGDVEEELDACESSRSMAAGLVGRRSLRPRP